MMLKTTSSILIVMNDGVEIGRDLLMIGDDDSSWLISVDDRWKQLMTFNDAELS